jgi:hypothetical protein
MGEACVSGPVQPSAGSRAVALSGAAKAASARRPPVRAPVTRPRRPAMALVVPAVGVVARPLFGGWPAMGIVGDLNRRSADGS